MFEEDIQLVTTEDATIFSHPSVIQFFTALIGASVLNFHVYNAFILLSSLGNPPDVEKLISEFLKEKKRGSKKRKVAEVEEEDFAAISVKKVKAPESKKTKGSLLSLLTTSKPQTSSSNIVPDPKPSTRYVLPSSNEPLSLDVSSSNL